MSTEANNPPVNQEALAGLPPDTPVVMINLLKFNDSGGHESYMQYTREVGPHLEKVGGRVHYGGTNPVTIIGDGPTPWWDAILVVEYPSPQAFISMVTDPEYLKAHEHRAAALEQGDLVATQHWMVG